MCALKIVLILVMAGVAIGLNITETFPAAKQRTACAQVDFNDPAKISYWSSFGGVGPVVGHGIDLTEAQKMLSAALINLTAIDDHQYKIDQIISAIKCIMSHDLYEFHANLIDKYAQTKSCVIQLYKNHQQLADGPITAVVISCPDETQYVKTYSEVQN